MNPGKCDQCSFGSGIKYKHFCEGKVVSPAPTAAPSEFNQLVPMLQLVSWDVRILSTGIATTRRTAYE